MSKDKVRPLKLEAIATGGITDDTFPTATDPNEDYIACKGIVFEDLDAVAFELVDNEISYTDSKQLIPLKLNNISNFSYHKIEADKTVIIKNDQHMITTSLEVDGFLELNGSIVML